MEYFWLLFGFVLLVVGADIFVEGSSALAKSFKIPTIIIGLTVVAFGTSMPEASVSISAALEGKKILPSATSSAPTSLICSSFSAQAR